MRHFREGSEDEGIWRAVYEANDYGLQGTWHGTVIDIGAHIGAFTCFAIDKLQSRQVISVEPVWENIKLLDKNVGDRSNVEPLWAAAGGVTGLPCAEVGDGWPNTGGRKFVAAAQGTNLLRTISLDDLLAKADYSPVLVKLDCEGAEYDILQGWTNDSMVGAVIGEWHAPEGDDPQKCRDRLRVLLEDRGFVVSTSCHPNATALGLFAAHRPEK